LQIFREGTPDLSHAIKRLSKQKPSWLKNGKKALKQLVLFMAKMFSLSI